MVEKMMKKAAEVKPTKLFKDFICYSSEEEYLNDKSCINAHLIMGYAKKDTLAFKEKSYEKPFFTVGKLTEDLVFHKDEIKDKYFIIDEYSSKQLAELSDLVLTWILSTLDPAEELKRLQETEDGKNKILDFVKTHELFGAIKKEETLFKKLKEDKFFDKVLLRFENLNKLCVTAEDYRIAEKLADKIVNSKVTKQIFQLRDKENVEFIDQFRIKIPNFFVSKVTAKIAVDLLVVDHNTREVFFYDIKTDRHSTHEFIKESYLEYRIDLQLDFYEKALISFISKNFPSYRINSPRLIVVSKGYLDQEAIIFAKSESLAGRGGFNAPITEDRRKNLRSYLLEILALKDMVGSLEKLSTIDQVSTYYLNNNFVFLPD